MLSSSLKTILWLLLGAWLAMAVGCLFLITIWTDEAWVLNGLRSIVEPVVENLSTEVIFTSGGPFALVNMLLEKAFGSAIWIHRAFSLLCLLGLLGIVLRMGTRSGRPAIAGALAIAPLLSITGTAEVGTLALGHSTACLLMVLGALVWTRDESPGLLRALGAGVLFGLAAACRTEMALVIAAILAVGAIRPVGPARFSVRLPWREGITAAVVLGVFAGCLVLLRAATPAIPTDYDIAIAAQSSGLGGGLLSKLLDYPRMLNKLLIGQSFGPLLLIMLASTLPFYVRSDDPAERRFSTLMVASAWMLLLGWLFRAPIPHLRYLWPALMGFAIPSGLALARLYDQARRQGQLSIAWLCLIVAVGGMVGGLSGTARSLVMGEGNLISFEWSREMGVDYFRRFQAPQDEAAAVRYLKTEIPADAEIYTIQPYKYKYLTHRPIFDTAALYTPKERERRAAAASAGQPPRRFMILPPEVGTFFYITPETDAWFRTQTKLAAEFGRHSIYELTGDWPENPEDFWFSRTNYLKHPLSTPWFGRKTFPAANQGK